MIAIEAVQTDYVYFYSDISTVEDVLAWESGYSLTNGLYAGFFLFVLIINLCLGILLRQQIHFWHGAYVLSVLCYTLSENMLDVLLLPQWLYAGFAQIPKIFFLVISVFFSTKVFQLFVRQQERYGFMHRVFKVYRYCLLGFIIIGVVAVIVAYPGFIRAGVFYQCCKVILLTGNFLLAANVLWGIIKKDKLVIAYAIASFLFFISVTDYVLVAYGKLNWLVITPGKITVSLTIEIFILTLYFIYEQQARLISIVKGLRQSQSEKLVLVNELVNAEDNEKQRLAKDLHDDLGTLLTGCCL